VECSFFPSEVLPLIFFFQIEYKKALNEHTRVAIEAMEDTIQEVCSSTNHILDAKLNEIYVVLEEIGMSDISCLLHLKLLCTYLQLN
jgi:hypothetical protein